MRQSCLWISEMHPFLTRNLHNPMPSRLPRSGGSAPSRILTAPLLDGKLLWLASWAAWSAAVSERGQARESRATARRTMTCSSSFARPQYARASRRREDGWRRNPSLGLVRLWRILKKRRVDQYKRMQLNPEATLACCHHLLTVPDIPPSNHRTTAAAAIERLREAYHVRSVPLQRSFLNLHRFARHAETVQPRSHHPHAMPIRGRMCIYRRAVCGLCGGRTQEPAQPL